MESHLLLVLDAYYSFVPSLDGTSFPESSFSFSLPSSAILDLEEPAVFSGLLSLPRETGVGTS